jgi:hypothetical protein
VHAGRIILAAIRVQPLPQSASAVNVNMMLERGKDKVKKALGGARSPQ